MIEEVLYAKQIFPLDSIKEVAIANEGIHVVGLEEPQSPELELLRGAIASLKPYKTKHAEKVLCLSDQEIIEICKKTPIRESRINQLTADIAEIKRHIGEIREWGDLLKYTRLKEKGYNVKFYLISGKKPFKLPYAYHRRGKQIVIISKENIENVPEDFIEIPIMGEVKQYNMEIERLERELSDLRKSMAKDAKAIPALKSAEKTMLYNLNLISFQKAVKERGKLGEINSFIPTVEKEKYIDRLKKHSGVYIRTPLKTENTPILLKNAWFASLFEILTKQGSVPKYGTDIDPTPLLMIPFWIYFGLCMPDIGYSALILGGVFTAKHIIKKNNITLGDSGQKLIDLVMVLGFAALLMGILSASFFGFTLIDSPILITEKIMGIGMWIGVAQLTFGILVKFFVSWKGRTEWKIIADAGWLAAYVGVVLWFNGYNPQNLIFYGMILALSVEGFEPYKGKFSIGNLLKYVGEWIGISMWNTFNRASGLFSDTISFVRIPVLFLVAIVLGNVVVELGRSMGGVVGIFIIIFGNLFVFLLSILGAVAHPARLQLIEFRHQFETGNENASFYKPFNR